MPRSLDSRLRDVQALLNDILEETQQAGGSPSHWELPILPPPDADGQLSSTDLLNWWFRSPRGQGRASSQPVGGEVGAPEASEAVPPPAGMPAPARDDWSEISALFPEPEEALTDEHAQAAVDCLYDFLHAVGQRDVEAACALLDDYYHTIENGQEVDKLRFRNDLARQLDTLRDWDFDVSLAVAPQPVNHPYGVLIHAVVQFDSVHRAERTRRGHVEHRVAIVRQDDSGAWRIAALPRVDR